MVANWSPKPRETGMIDDKLNFKIWLKVT